MTSAPRRGQKRQGKLDHQGIFLYHMGINVRECVSRQVRSSMGCRRQGHVLSAVHHNLKHVDIIMARPTGRRYRSGSRLPDKSSTLRRPVGPNSRSGE